MKIHEVKTWIRFEQDIITARKNFEVCKDDRDYQVGDVIKHKFWNEDLEQYTGKEYTQLITYYLEGGQFGIQDGYCVLGVTPCALSAGLSSEDFNKISKNIQTDEN